MLIIFQMVFVFFSMFMILNLLKKRKNNRILSKRGLFFWILFWISADIAVLWPNSTTLLANTFGIGRGSDFVIY